jgi:hypothetical protein
MQGKHTNFFNPKRWHLRMFAVACILLVFSACSGDSDNPLDVDVSDVKVALTCHDLVPATNAARKDSLNRKALMELLRSAELADIAPAYCSQVLMVGNLNDPMLEANLRHFLEDDLTWKAVVRIDKVFGDKAGVKADLELGFRHLKYHFPDAPIPTVAFTYNAFNYGMFPTETSLICGMEMYLGSEDPIVKEIPLYDFIKAKMKPEHLVVDAMRAWVDFHVAPPSKAEDFLGAIIYEGKLMYLTEACLPALPPHVLMRYTADEYSWCYQNEVNIWQEVVDNKILYSKDELNVSKFLNDGPFTAGLPRESPSRVGQWLGWMIVRDYMRANPEMTLQQLLDQTNNQAILSAYQPGENE